MGASGFLPLHVLFPEDLAGGGMGTLELGVRDIASGETVEMTVELERHHPVHSEPALLPHHL